MFVPDTRVDCLLLKVFQSVEVNLPLWEVVASCIDKVIAGVVLGFETVPLMPLAVVTATLVTVPEPPLPTY